ncbi:MAG TPA: hypothetical protein VFQ39_00800 [Longimicrobium sp.]|nr:hypothetical protein [Longimicrobium sp.]
MAENVFMTVALRWSITHVYLWKIWPDQLGGGDKFLWAFKDVWVSYNRNLIKKYAYANNIPPELLAGIAHIEVGGDPTEIDIVAFSVRTFDWSGPKWVDDHLTITKPPAETSFGPVSMQLRTAARTLGKDPDKMTPAQLLSLGLALQRDTYNLQLAAKHLRDLAEYDFPGTDTRRLSDEQIVVIGSRYNRGMISIEKLKEDLSNGKTVLKRWSRMTKLLK